MVVRCCTCLLSLEGTCIACFNRLAIDRVVPVESSSASVAFSKLQFCIVSDIMGDDCGFCSDICWFNLSITYSSEIILESS